MACCILCAHSHVMWDAFFLEFHCSMPQSSPKELTVFTIGSFKILDLMSRICSFLVLSILTGHQPREVTSLNRPEHKTETILEHFLPCSTCICDATYSRTHLMSTMNGWMPTKCFAKALSSSSVRLPIASDYATHPLKRAMTPLPIRSSVLSGIAIKSSSLSS